MKARPRYLLTYYHELSNYLWSLRRSSSQTRFVYWANSRSGSHLFRDLLNSHPHIHCVSEGALFRKERRYVLNPFRYIDGESKRVPSKVFGCKMNILRLDRQQGSVEEVTKRLHEDGWQFIRLRRENLLGQAISSQVRKKRGIGHDYSPPAVDDLQIEIDIGKLLKKMHDRLLVDQRIDQLLIDYQPLQLIYERDLIDAGAQQRTANRVFDYLGLEHCRVTTDFIRTGRFAYSEYIRNYDDVVTELNGTPFEKFLSESARR